MKKKIIIDSEDPVIVKEEKIIKNNNISTNLINNKYIEWLIYMIGYAIVLVTVSFLFDSLYINLKHFGIYALLAAIIMSILNETLKPILRRLTLPLTILTGGLFYPVINIIILYLTSLILGPNNFRITGIIAPFFVVFFITILNYFMEGIILKPITNKRGKHE